MQIKKILTFKKLFFSVSVAFALMVGLASHHFKSLVLNPIAAWHGTVLSVQSFVYGSPSERDKFILDKARIEKASFTLKPMEVELQEVGIENADTKPLALSHQQVKNQIAAYQARQAWLKKRTDRLKQTSIELIETNKSIELMSQEFSSIAVYRQTEAARQQAVENSLNSDLELPTEAEELIAIRSQLGARDNLRIPKKVLKSVQQATGISPEEVEQLLNR